jgi:hypothetical protein
LSLVGVTAPAEARITSIVVTTKTSPAFGGQSFGDVGQYEQLDGTASGETDPKYPLNAVIQDIDLAPRNSCGMVEYSMDFSILKPIDTSRGNHTIHDVVNRGNKSSPYLNGTCAISPATGSRVGGLHSSGRMEGTLRRALNKPADRQKKKRLEITGGATEYIPAPASTVDIDGTARYEASAPAMPAPPPGAFIRTIPKRSSTTASGPADCSTVSFERQASKVCLSGGFIRTASPVGLYRENRR